MPSVTAPSRAAARHPRWRPRHPGSVSPAPSTRAGPAGSTTSASSGGVAPGREEREHRAAEAAAHDPRAGRAGVLQPRHRALDGVDGDLVVVAQARVRGVEQRAEARRGRRRAARPPPPRRARSRSGRGARGDPAAPGAGRARRPARRAARRCRAPRTPRGTPRGGRCSPSPRARARGPKAATASVQPRRSSATGSIERSRQSRRRAWPSCPKSAASWSSRPVCAPTQSFSTREHSRASSRRSPSGSLGERQQRQRERRRERRRRGQAAAARQVAADVQAGAADRVAGRAQLAHRPAHEGPPALAVARRGGGVEVVVLAEVGGVRLDAPAVEGLARAPSPRGRSRRAGRGRRCSRCARRSG